MCSVGLPFPETIGLWAKFGLWILAYRIPVFWVDFDYC